jgi:hypothetical protein
MSTLRVFPTLSMLLLALTTAAPLQGQGSAAPSTAPDATLYTSYFSGSGYQNISWVVCGSTTSTEGCYDSGSLGPFGRAGAIIEGNPSANLKTSTVTRYIYVVDIASGSGGNAVTLYVYKKTDSVSSSFDTTTVKLTNTVSLPLTGGSKALCSMAANQGFLFIGTDQSPDAVRVQKSNLSMAQFGGFSPPINVTAITSDKYGYVAVTFGSGTNTGNIEFGPNGNSVGDGGGAWFMLNTVFGVSTSSLPASDYLPADRLVVRPKQAQKQSGRAE